jgi:hypothetical protein
MTIDELDVLLDEIIERGSLFNQEIKKARRADAPFGDAMNATVDLSGGAVQGYMRIRGWWREAKREALKGGGT